MALVGRPNVGKSALFNRLVGRRLAIVHAEAGITRDRLASEACWNEQAFTLIDTGGIGLMDRQAPADEITAGARRQVDLAIEEAAVVIFVADLAAGLHPLDEEVARLLRRRGRPVLLAANKADHPAHDAAAVDFARLGFSVFPVSALHDRGLAPLMEAVMPLLPPPAPEPTSTRPLVLAVVGRPNAGKSSYVNRLLQRDRVIVSTVPGTTRDNIEVPFVIGRGPQARHYLLIDTAGMRPSRKVDTAVEKFSLIRVEEAVRRADVVAVVLDAARGPSRQDKHIAARVQAEHKGCVLIVNKWDLAAGTGVTPRTYRDALHRELPFLDYAPLLFVSAATGAGVRASIDAVDRVGAAVSTTVTTGILNRALHDIFARQSPPAVKGRRFRFYYAVQTGVRPFRLRLFVNDPSLCAGSYEQYVIHRLREAFGLEGAPVRLRFAARPTARYFP